MLNLKLYSLQITKLISVNITVMLSNVDFYRYALLITYRISFKIAYVLNNIQNNSIFKFKNKYYISQCYCCM